MIERGKGWEMHLGDCLAVMAGMEKVDHVITDPPYDNATHRTGAARTNKGGKAGNIDIDFAPFTEVEMRAFVQHALRLSRRWCLAFGAVEQMGDYKRAAGEAWVRACIWDRPDGTPQLSGDRPAQSAEGIALWHLARPMRWNGKGKRGTWRCGVEREDRGHPTQKPVDLMLALVADFTDPGETILDPFAGSGTTGVACLRLGRHFIGIEKDPKYFALAVERLRAEEQGSTLQASRAGQMPLLGGVR